MSTSMLFHCVLSGMVFLIYAVSFFLVDGAVLVGKAHDQPVADKRRQIQLGKQLGIGRRFADEHVAKAGAKPLLKGQDGCVFCIHWFHP